MLNELISNALEHGLPDQAPGSIAVTFASDAGAGEMRVADNGIGLPEGFSLETGQNLGLRIARALIADDLKGTLTIHSDGGAVATVRFPLHALESRSPLAELPDR